ncbi:MAG: DinB family protein, partial [Fuerstiella sp.]
MSDIQTLLDRYSTGCDLLRTAVEQISASDYDAIPVAGKWSVRQVVCHIADFEPIYA